MTPAPGEALEAAADHRDGARVTIATERGDCPHCHGNEELEVGTCRDPVTGAWDTETVRCACTTQADDEPPY